MTLAGLITDNPFVKYGLLILIASDQEDRKSVV